MIEKYTVWVGGTEVTSTHIPKEQAEFIANEFEINGYDDSTRRYCETMKHIRKIMADLKYKMEQDND